MRSAAQQETEIGPLPESWDVPPLGEVIEITQGLSLNRTTIPNISRASLAHLASPHPEPDEQREIAAILDAVDRKIGLHRRKRTVQEELFKALPHKLMTGEVRVGELDLGAVKGEAPDG